MKKKIFAIIISAILSIALLAGCATNQDSNNSSSLEDNNNNVSSSEGNGDASSSENEEKTVIKIGATPSPHAEILEKANEILEKEGYTLDIIEFTDYVQPNLAVDSGELDANYFQHQPYLDAFNEERGTDIVIVENPKKLEIIEIEAAQIPHSLQDVDIAVINGNYAIEAGLKVKTDALATEDADSIGATTYGNVVAVKKGNENNEAIQALVKALKSDEIKQYMEETYEGAVVPLFE